MAARDAHIGTGVAGLTIGRRATVVGDLTILGFGTVAVHVATLGYIHGLAGAGRGAGETEQAARADDDPDAGLAGLALVVDEALTGRGYGFTVPAHTHGAGGTLGIGKTTARVGAVHANPAGYTDRRTIHARFAILGRTAIVGDEAKLILGAIGIVVALLDRCGLDAGAPAVTLGAVAVLTYAARAGPGDLAEIALLAIVVIQTAALVHFPVTVVVH